MRTFNVQSAHLVVHVRRLGRLRYCLRLKTLSQLLQAHFLVPNLKVLFVCLSVSNHTNLQFHLGDAPVTHIGLLLLGFSLLLEGVDQFEQLLTVVSLLADVSFKLLVVGVDFGLDLAVDVVDLVAELGHQGVGLASQLRSVLLELLK